MTRSTRCESPVPFLYSLSYQEHLSHQTNNNKKRKKAVWDLENEERCGHEKQENNLFLPLLIPISDDSRGERKRGKGKKANIPNKT